MVKRSGYIRQAWLVLILAAGFGAALAGVYVGLRNRINQNKKNATYDQIPKLVCVTEGGHEKRAEKALTEELQIEGRQVYKAFWRDPNDRAAKPEHIGWVIRASGQGYADRIELLVGLDAKAERLLGIYVLDQKETPGLGDGIRSSWRNQFAGKSALEDLKVVKNEPKDNEIRAISGATISSKSVTKIVNKAIIEFRNALIERKVSAN